MLLQIFILMNLSIVLDVFLQLMFLEGPERRVQMLG